MAMNNNKNGAEVNFQ